MPIIEKQVPGPKIVFAYPQSPEAAAAAIIVHTNIQALVLFRHQKCFSVTPDEPELLLLGIAFKKKATRQKALAFVERLATATQRIIMVDCLWGKGGSYHNVIPNKPPRPHLIVAEICSTMRLSEHSIKQIFDALCQNCPGDLVGLTAYRAGGLNEVFIWNLPNNARFDRIESAIKDVYHQAGLHAFWAPCSVIPIHHLFGTEIGVR